MRKGLLTSILMLTFGGLQAQPLPAVPKLVVTLTIDQLRTDYMEAFSSLYGEKGFKRLLREGKVFRSAQFSFADVDRASAVASLNTGTTPSVNGIVGSNWMDVGTLRTVECVDDPAFMGNYTDENTSPAKLLTSTVADELRIGTLNKAIVYAIAPFRDAAVLSAGHAGNAAFWLNAETGKWCSTTYYGDFPWWLSLYNDKQAPDSRIDDLTWTPVHSAESYRYLPDERTEAFKYKFASEHENKYRRLITSPLVNEEVNRLAETILDKTEMGTDNVPDLLALTYYAGNYRHLPTRDCGMEVQDSYVRLDRSIAGLLEILDRTVGLQNVLLCVCSTGYSDPEAPDAAPFRIPGGEFYMNRCTTLLNMYFMAIYGEGNYVETYHGQHIYLNHDLLEKKGIDLNEVEEKAADFLMQFSGVNEVYTGHRLLLGAWSPRTERIRRSFHRKRSGDIIIEVLPGWTIMEEHQTSNRVVRTAPILAPLIFLGGSLKAETLYTPVDMERVAPTLSSAMRIRAPNACDGTPLL